MLRVGLAGAGMISRHHLIAWSRVPDARVVAICDPDRSATLKLVDAVYRASGLPEQ